MSYDIYGNNLKRGHCEVHPQVAEEYPCSLCYEQDKSRNRNKQQYNDIDRQQEKEYYEAMEREHFGEFAKKNNFLYSMLCFIANLLAKCLKRVEGKKEQIYQNKKRNKGVF